jgi:hypothetical protein
MIAAPAKMTQSAAVPLTSVAPITTTSPPVRRNLGHQRVRRVRATRAPLRRAGLPARATGRPSAPGTGGTGPSWSRRHDRAVISPVQQSPDLIARPSVTPDPFALAAGHTVLAEVEHLLANDIRSRSRGADLASRLSVSSREIPLLTTVNDTSVAKAAWTTLGECVAGPGRAGYSGSLKYQRWPSGSSTV